MLEWKVAICSPHFCSCFSLMFVFCVRVCVRCVIRGMAKIIWFLALLLDLWDLFDTLINWKMTKSCNLSQLFFKTNKGWNWLEFWFAVCLRCPIMKLNAELMSNDWMVFESLIHVKRYNIFLLSTFLVIFVCIRKYNVMCEPS